VELSRNNLQSVEGWSSLFAGKEAPRSVTLVEASLHYASPDSNFVA
jgi:hypothetical protein